MFTFALITGVKNGWLDAATYGPAARKAWIAVTGFIDQNSDITSVCEGTGKIEQSRLLPRTPAADRRLPRPGTGALGSLRAAPLAASSKSPIGAERFSRGHGFTGLGMKKTAKKKPAPKPKPAKKRTPREGVNQAAVRVVREATKE